MRKLVWSSARILFWLNISNLIIFHHFRVCCWLTVFKYDNSMLFHSFLFDLLKMTQLGFNCFMGIVWSLQRGWSFCFDEVCFPFFTPFSLLKDGSMKICYGMLPFRSYPFWMYSYSPLLRWVFVLNNFHLIEVWHFICFTCIFGMYL